MKKVSKSLTIGEKESDRTFRETVSLISRIDFWVRLRVFQGSHRDRDVEAGRVEIFGPLPKSVSYLDSCKAGKLFLKKESLYFNFEFYLRSLWEWIIRTCRPLDGDGPTSTTSRTGVSPLRVSQVRKNVTFHKLSSTWMFYWINSSQVSNCQLWLATDKLFKMHSWAFIFRWNLWWKSFHGPSYWNQNALCGEGKPRLYQAPHGIFAWIPRVLVLVEAPVGTFLERQLVKIYCSCRFHHILWFLANCSSLF